MEDKKKLNLPEGVPPLTTYYMYITGGCNLACRHCWISPTFEPNGGMGQCLDYDLFKIAIDEALPLGLSRIKFTGGEPLLHPDFVKMVGYTTEKGLKTNLETNGTLITKKLARHLKEKTSLYHIAVSVDGATATTHDFLRNVPGCYDDAIKGIKYLVEAGYRPQIIMSLYPENVKEIESLIDFAKKNTCSSVKFNIIQSSGRAEQMKNGNGLLLIDELVQLGRWVEKDLQSRFSIPLFYSWPMAFHGIKRLHRGLGENCNIFYILGVLSSGGLALCGIGTHEKDLTYGSLDKDKVFDVWGFSPGLKKLRDSIPDKLEGICSQCIFKNRCMGACIAQNYHSKKSITAPFWFCQQADDAGLFFNSKKI